MTCCWLGAAPVRADLVVRVPDGCGSQAEFTSGVRRLAPDAASLPEARVEIDPLEAGAGFRLRVLLGDNARTLEHAECKTLWKSALIIVAAAASAPDAAVSPSETTSLAAAVGGGAAFGVVPNVGGHYEAQARLERAGWGAALAFSYTPQTTSSHLAGKPAVRVRNYALRLGATATPSPLLRLGLGVAIQRWHGAGLHTDGDSDAGVWSGAVVAEATLVPLRLGPASLELALLGQWALTRPSFEVDGLGPLYRAPQLAAAVLARFAWLFF